MRIVYVAGFYSPALTELKKQIKPLLENRSVVWIPQLSNGGIEINSFKRDLLDVTQRGATEALLLLFIFPGQEHVLEILQAITDVAEARSSHGLVVRIEQAEQLNARDHAWIISKIREFKPDSNRRLPNELYNLPKWVLENHSGKIFLHPRAAHAAKKSKYEDIALIYAAINLLGNEYRNMRIAGEATAAENRESFEAKLKELGLEMSPAMNSGGAGQYGDEYYVKYPSGKNTKRLLDHHLKKGSSREERYCLRIYFFWDDDSKQTVIGWLPGHLDTKAT